MTRDIIELNEFIVLIEESYVQKTVVEYCELNEKAIGIVFYGTGDLRFSISSRNHQKVYESTKNRAISFYGEQMKFSHTISPDNPLQSITIFITHNNLSKLREQERELFGLYLKRLMTPTQDLEMGPSILMSPEMKNAVDRIFKSTYKGAVRLMFLRSQVTELLAHFFANASNDVMPVYQNNHRDKLYQAKEILTTQMEAPPSLNELSKLIGLNSSHLKKKFKELFGMPVFKYLQHERLTKAYHLIHEEGIGVQEAAWKVGYESVSSFSNAFVKKFGYRPSELKK